MLSGLLSSLAGGLVDVLGVERDHASIRRAHGGTLDYDGAILSGYLDCKFWLAMRTSLPPWNSHIPGWAMATVKRAKIATVYFILTDGWFWLIYFLTV